MFVCYTDYIRTCEVDIYQFTKTMKTIARLFADLTAINVHSKLYTKQNKAKKTHYNFSVYKNFLHNYRDTKSITRNM